MARLRQREIIPESERYRQDLLLHILKDDTDRNEYMYTDVNEAQDTLEK